MSHHAKLNHAELASSDPAATQKFLEQAFGLKFRELGEEMGNYRMHGREDGAQGADIGIRGLMGPTDLPGTVAYFEIPDIDAAVKSVQEAGAKIVMAKTEVPGVGWLAVYVAPGGVTQGVFQYKTPR